LKEQQTFRVFGKRELRKYWHSEMGSAGGLKEINKVK
jgi:hypothetical protein